MESCLTPTPAFHTSTYYGPGLQGSDVSTESIGRQSSNRIHELPEYLVQQSRRISGNSAATWHTALACQDKNRSRGSLGAATINRNRRLSRSTDFGMYPPSSADEDYVSPGWRPTGWRSFFAKLVNAITAGLAITGGAVFLRSLEGRNIAIGILLLVIGICLLALEMHLPRFVYNHMHFLCSFYGRGGLFVILGFLVVSDNLVSWILAAILIFFGFAYFFLGFFRVTAPSNMQPLEARLAAHAAAYQTHA